MNTFVPSLLIKSISKAGANATISPGSLREWVDEINTQVVAQGKFSKKQVAYIPFSPPPALWDYKCRKCRFWKGSEVCSVVSGNISPRGWCVIWLPPDYSPAFSWVGELARGDW